MTTPKLTPTEIEAIRHRWSLGETAASLAECFDVSTRTIERRCKGIPSPLTRKIDTGKVYKLRDKGHSYLDIAVILKCDRWSVLRAIRRERERAAA